MEAVLACAVHPTYLIFGYSCCLHNQHQQAHGTLLKTGYTKLQTAVHPSMPAGLPPPRRLWRRLTWKLVVLEGMAVLEGSCRSTETHGRLGQYCLPAISPAHPCRRLFCLYRMQTACRQRCMQPCMYRMVQASNMQGPWCMWPIIKHSPPCDKSPGSCSYQSVWPYCLHCYPQAY